MNVRAFLHLAGSKQAPEHSEYEVEMSGVSEIVVVENAKLINESFLQVIDEKKPVFAVIYSIFDEKIWKFDSHMEGSKKNQGNIKAIPVLSTDLGVMFVQKVKNYPKVFFSIRVGSEEYLAGDISGVSGRVNCISLDDLIEFVSGKITWENIRGRSHLFEKRRAKEESCQKKNAELANEVRTLTEKLGKIPTFLRRIFSAT